jgi:hypothetical protein
VSVFLLNYLRVTRQGWKRYRRQVIRYERLPGRKIKKNG